MKLSEKLKDLRVSKNLTQEQLAEKLYVTRAAISKWEQDNGYPSIDSLKNIASFFSVSIDDLLSANDLIVLVKKDTFFHIERVNSIIYSILDMLTLLFIFLPLYGQLDQGIFQSVPLNQYHDVSNLTIVLYYIAIFTLVIYGMVGLILQFSSKNISHHKLKILSFIINFPVILLFALTRQPYVSSFLLIFMMIKLLLSIKSYIK